MWVLSRSTKFDDDDKTRFLRTNVVAADSRTFSALALRGLALRAFAHTFKALALRAFAHVRRPLANTDAEFLILIGYSRELWLKSLQ